MTSWTHDSKLALLELQVLSGCGRVRVESKIGTCDVYRVDPQSCAVTLVADDVHRYDPGGMPMGKIKILELVCRPSFGSAKLNKLFIRGTISLNATWLGANGLRFSAKT